MEILLACGVFVLVLGATVSSVFLRAWVLTVLWGWFAVTTFHFPPISIAAAVGFSVIVGLFRFIPYTALPPATDPVERRKRYMHFVSQTVFVPFASLFMGWLVHLCM